ncbi:MAG: hypothetical protein WCF85_18960 [Rhodospirillaceae bacterium]
MNGSMTSTFSWPELSADPDSPSMESISRSIDDLAVAVGEARIRLEGGENIDLAGMDEQVRAICSAIGRLNGPAARMMLPQLVALTDGIDSLELVLKRTRYSAGPPVVPHRAAEAYGAARAAK